VTKRIHGDDLLLVGPLREGANIRRRLSIGEVWSRDTLVFSLIYLDFGSSCVSETRPFNQRGRLRGTQVQYKALLYFMIRVVDSEMITTETKPYL
jgi:hypothetical protein